MSTTKMPITSDELRQIADQIDAYAKAVEQSDGLFLSLGNVEIRNPESFEEVWGHIVSCDDWYGFAPAPAN